MLPVSVYIQQASGTRTKISLMIKGRVIANSDGRRIFIKSPCPISVNSAVNEYLI